MLRLFFCTRSPFPTYKKNPTDINLYTNHLYNLYILYKYGRMGGEKEGMTLITEMKFSDVRKEFTDVIDNVQRFNPVIIQPRKKSEDTSLIPKKEFVDRLLDSNQLHPEIIQEPDGSYTVSLDELSLVTNHEDKEKAIDELVQEAKDYALEYIGEIEMYLKSPNRQSHAPLVMKIILCDNEAEIKSMIFENAKV